MPELIRTWLLGLTAAAFLTTIAMTLTPKGRPRAVVGLVSGLVTIVALIAPIVEFDFHAYARDTSGFEAQLEAQLEEMEAAQERLTSLLISQRSQAYIWDKAERLGLGHLTVEVATTQGADGWPVPDRVWVVGAVSPGDRQILSEFLTDTFGIPVNRQYWSESDE
ncbi:MAG: hypothetical protein FWE28_06280 [Oscillospiraceae bacterium]|nr:hypothetical protein [Oscillospiraceae bacterium]